LSEDEYATLDQLNGLVMAGEIALERLQRAGETRVAEGGREFENHYELAAHLLNQPSVTADAPIDDSGIGRVDLLFDLLRELKMNTPSQLDEYLDALHSDLERRPLAEQVVDALVAADSTRYDVYREVRARGATYEHPDHAQNTDLSVGRFLNSWIRLEKLERDLAPPEEEGRGRRIRPTGLGLELAEFVSPATAKDIHSLRRLRNGVIHGQIVPPATELSDAADRLDAIIASIEDGGDHNGRLVLAR
ncbi:hypothetical protein B2J88_52255, partial [Rhodococcus sp. SRB_17]|nr:hypothetical protein [Rhodococcus sp. SRB_17]